MEKMSLVVAIKHFFGNRPGESTASEFMKEFRALDDNDKAYFKRELEKAGYVIQ